MKRMKNVFVAVTAAACLLTSALTALPASAAGEIKGDVNLDGRVDVTDLSQLSIRVSDNNHTYYLGGTQKFNCDLDNDGRVDIIDVITLRYFISTGNATQAGINAARGAKKGDVNLDGRIDVTDLSLLKLRSFQGGLQKYNADIDNNGRIDYFDEYTLTRWIANP